MNKKNQELSWFFYITLKPILFNKFIATNSINIIKIIVTYILDIFLFEMIANAYNKYITTIVTIFSNNKFLLS